MIAVQLRLSDNILETVLVNPAHIVTVRSNAPGVGSIINLAHGHGTLYVEETQSDIFDRIMEIRR